MRQMMRWHVAGHRGSRRAALEQARSPCRGSSGRMHRRSPILYGRSSTERSDFRQTVDAVPVPRHAGRESTARSYSHDFIERATRHRLQYLVEADFHEPCSTGEVADSPRLAIPPEGRGPTAIAARAVPGLPHLPALPADAPCREGALAAREPDPEALRSLYVGASTRPKSGEPDVASDEPLCFVSEKDGEVTTPHPLFESRLSRARSDLAPLDTGFRSPRRRPRASLGGRGPSRRERGRDPSAPLPPSLLRRARDPATEHALPLRDGDFGAPPGERSCKAPGPHSHQGHEPQAREHSARGPSRQDLRRASRRHARSRDDRARDEGSPSGEGRRDRRARGGCGKGDRLQLRSRGPVRAPRRLASRSIIAFPHVGKRANRVRCGSVSRAAVPSVPSGSSRDDRFAAWPPGLSPRSAAACSSWAAATGAI